MGGIGAPELLIILVVVLIFFGGAKLPKLARSLGQAQGEFKKGLGESNRAELGDDGSSQGQPGQPGSGQPGRNDPQS